MKNKITIALLVLGIGLVSCKKVYNYPESKKNELTVNNTITDKSLVSDNSVWTIVDMPPYGATTTKRYFKFESNGKFILIDKQDSVDPYYWKSDKFFIGATFYGSFVRSLM